MIRKLLPTTLVLLALTVAPSAGLEAGVEPGADGFKRRMMPPEDEPQTSGLLDLDHFGFARPASSQQCD